MLDIPPLLQTASQNCTVYNNYKRSFLAMDNQEPIVIRTQHKREFAFIILNSNDLSLENFMIAGEYKVI